MSNQNQTTTINAPEVEKIVRCMFLSNLTRQQFPDAFRLEDPQESQNPYRADAAQEIARLRKH